MKNRKSTTSLWITRQQNSVIKDLSERAGVTKKEFLDKLLLNYIDNIFAKKKDMNNLFYTPLNGVEL